MIPTLRFPTFSLSSVFVVGLLALFFALPLATYAASATLTAEPSEFYSGGEVTVTWDSSDAWKCVGSGFSTDGKTKGTKTFAVNSTGTKTYSVTCYDQSPECSLVQQSSYTRSFAGSNTCNNISYSPNGSCYPKYATCQTSTLVAGKPIPGEPGVGTTYQITNYRCDGGCSIAEASDSVRVNQAPPPPEPSVTLSLSPSVVKEGNSALLSWEATRATSCRGTGFSTGGSTKDSVQVTPTGNTTYSITCDSEVFSDTPGTWEYKFADITDLWCTQEGTPPSYNNYYTENQCPDNKPPSGSCTGSEVCSVNTWQTGVGDSKGGPIYCNLYSDVYRCNGGSAPNQVTDEITVTYNRAPNKPTITGPQSGVVQTAYTFSFKATDPDGDTVRYRVDWDNDGIVDQTFPSSGYVNSNTSRDGIDSYSNTGTYTFKARTQDENGAQSDWQPHIITIGTSGPECSDGIDNDSDGLTDLDDYGCSGAGDSSESPNPQCSDGIENDSDGFIDYPADPGCVSLADTTESPNPQCSDGIDNDGNGLIDLADTLGCDNASDNNESTPDVKADITFTASPELVRADNPVTISWSATDVTSCTVAGSNGDNWTGTSGTQTSSNITAETTFVIVCEEIDGDSASDSETVKLVPSFEEVFRSLPATLASAFGAVLRY